jgi:hypothetical protein
MSNQEEKEPTLTELLAKIPSHEIVKMLDQANYWAPEIKAANFRLWVSMMVKP